MTSLTCLFLFIFIFSLYLWVLIQYHRIGSASDISNASAHAYYQTSSFLIAFLLLPIKVVIVPISCIKFLS